MISNFTNKIIQGDCLEVLKQLPDDSIDCIITSPPYWSLRSYLSKEHPDKAKEIGLEPTFDCGKEGMMKLRDNLTQEEKLKVIAELLDK